MQRARVAGSGAAIASGGYANSGVHIGDVNLLTGQPVRTCYRHQVQRIAPRCLFGRDDELAELAEFCTSPLTSGHYAWWRAEAWSGKSALMSWFVLHPPPGVRIVSFFVTARMASQGDRPAFIDNVLEQLLALLGEGMPTYLCESTRDAHLLGLLTSAAEACQRRGEHLVLLVDGLDEDCGVNGGPDAHSIAGLLPAEPPAGMRVVVAGRPNPPIPADVPHHHPLRDKTIVRALRPSEHAQAIREEMEREIKRLLHGSDTERDLIGLVTSAGGGLSAEDLEKLTAWSEWEIRDRLRTVAGRSFSVRDSIVRAEGPELYLLGHEELQVAALEMLGSVRVGKYRQRLCAWAERYDERRWPADTPEYLLRGYFRMLRACGDVARMLSCATDLGRQDRMFAVYGGDATALSEITATFDVLAAQESPDLIALTRLAIHRDHLVDRNSHLPTELPAVWTTLGQPNHAVAIADSISNRHDHLAALLSMAKASFEIGNHVGVIEVIDRAEQVARAMPDPDERARALVSVVDAAVGAGCLDRAEHITGAMTNYVAQAKALASMVKAAIAAKELDRAELVARTIAVPDARAAALTCVAGAAAAAGNLGTAERLLGHIANADHRASAVVSVVEGAAEAGDFDSALRIVASVDDRHQRAIALAGVAKAMAAARRPRRALTVLREAEQLACADKDLRSAFVHGLHIALSLTRIAEAAASAGFVDYADQLLGSINRLQLFGHGHAPVDRVAGAAAAAGYLDGAERLACAVTDPRRRTSALTLVAAAVAAAGDLDHAESIASAITDFGSRTKALTRVANAAAVAGDHAGAQRIAHHISTAARSVTDAGEHATVLLRIVRAAATVGDLAGAERLARSFTGPVQQAQALAIVAAAAATIGNLDRAGEIAADIESIACSGTDPATQAEALTWAAGAAVTARRLADAERITHRVVDPHRGRGHAGVGRRSDRRSR